MPLLVASRQGEWRIDVHKPISAPFSQLSWAASRATPLDMTAMVVAQMTGTVWKIETAVGSSVGAGDTLLILESMKMEMPLESPSAGVVQEIRCQEGQAVSEGDVLLVLALT